MLHFSEYIIYQKKKKYIILEYIIYQKKKKYIIL